MHCFRARAGRRFVIQNNTSVRPAPASRWRKVLQHHVPAGPAYANGAPQILNNKVSYTGEHGNGINLQGANNALISGNEVSYWNHDGIDIKNASGVIVDGNIAHDRLTGGAAFYIEQGDATFQRNIAYNASNGFQVSTGASGKIYNNSISNSPTAVYFGPNASSLNVANNAVKGSATGL